MYDKVLKIIAKSKAATLQTKRIDLYYLIAIYIKNLCDNNIDGYTYENVNNENYQEIIKKISRLVGFNFTVIRVEMDIEKILKIIKDVSIDDLIADMFKAHEKKLGINLLAADLKKVCYVMGYDFNSYDIRGNTTYIYILKSDISVYMLLDELLGIHNDYQHTRDYKITDDIEYVYITNTSSTNRLFDMNNGNKEFMDIFRKCLYQDKTIVLKTAYKTISFINRYLPLTSIKKIVLNSKYERNESILYFHNDRSEDKVSLILYDEDKVDIAGLKKIIDDNKENKENLIKITRDDLINNNYRIGFKLYATNDQKEIAKTINEMVDTNRRYMKEIDRMDYIISTEIDKLISK